MVVFIESGRLGNQLFQYAALRALALDRGERVVLLGFSELADVFDGVEATIIARPSIAIRGLMRFRGTIDALFTRMPFVGLISSVPGEPKRALKIRAAGIGGLSYGLLDWFDSGGSFTPESIASLQVKPALLDWAREMLARAENGPRPRVFVHVRRGDFLHWPSVEHPAVLPASWYRQMMTLMRTKYRDPLFVFVTDDVPYVLAEFGESDGFVISAGGSAQDFAVMTLCDGGILSASTYSWWGALFASRQNRSACFVGPLHWDLHPLGTGEGPRSTHHHIEYIAVSSLQSVVADA